MKKISFLLLAVIFTVCFICGCSAKPETTDAASESGGAADGALTSSAKAAESGTAQTDTAETAAKNSDTEPSVTEEADSGSSALQKAAAQNGSAAAVAFVGYVSDKSTETELRTFFKNSETGKKYSFLSVSPMFAVEGQELYAITPVNGRGRVTVYASSMTDGGEYADSKNSPLYEGKAGEPLLLRCNLSEIYSNVLVSVTDGGGAIEFRPAVSLENGQLQGAAGVYDFSVYSDDEGVRDEVMNAYDLLLKTDEVKYRTDRGMILQYTGQTQEINGRTYIVFALGTDNGDAFVREIYYGVCGESVCVYDAVSDTWDALGAG